MNRRRFITILGGSGLGILAGCSESSERRVRQSQAPTPLVPASPERSHTPTDNAPTSDSATVTEDIQSSSDDGDSGDSGNGGGADDDSSNDGGNGGGADDDSSNDGGSGGGGGGGGGHSTPTETPTSDSNTVQVTGNGAAPYNDGDYVRYIIETSGTMEPSDESDLEQEDVVGESSAAGWVPADGGDTDSFALTGGKILDISSWGGDVSVTIDGNTWPG